MVTETHFPLYGTFDRDTGALLRIGEVGTTGFVLVNSVFSTTLLNGAVAPITGPSFVYPGGSSTLTVTGTTFNGAIVTLQQSIDGGTTWNTVPGDSSSLYAAGGCFINGIASGVLVRCVLTGTPGTAITAILAR